LSSEKVTWEDEKVDEERDEIKEMRLILEEWKTVVQTQMHFNDMIMRIRTTGVSIVLAVFGAAAYSLQFDKLYLRVSGFNFHAAVPIVLFGLGMLSGVLILDYCYYYKMLLGAVKRGYEIDEAYKNRKINGMKMYGMTTLIRKEIGPAGRSKWYIFIFYGITFFLGIAFLVAILTGYIPAAE